MLVAHDDKAVVGKNAYTGPDDGNTHFTVLQNLEWAFGTQSDWTHYTYKVNTGDFGYLDFYLSNSGGEPDDIFFDNISVYRASDICTVEAEVNVNNHPGQSKGGTATASLPTVLPGSSVTLTATANEGFTFDAWFVYGAAVL
ncbi:MAG: hypothetical protein KBS41_04925, partial [Oscillospiraceae bacterium]|nr:hypothetical protein [Candidatus Equicaccousia limihippi]